MRIKKRAVSYFRSGFFVILLSALVLTSFALPFIYVDFEGERKIQSVGNAIGADNTEPLSIIERTIDWEEDHIDSTYQKPHTPDHLFYALSKRPYVHVRLHDAQWMMFFERGACEEWAVLFAELTKAAGLDNLCVIHNLGIDHAWAEVKINENWVHVDPSKIDPVTKTRGIINDPDYYERPDNENGLGEHLFFVYAVGDSGITRDVTKNYVEDTGELVVRVERNGSPVSGARVFIKNKRGTSTSFLTGENGTCKFNLGEGDYTIIAESGGLVGYQSEKNMHVSNSENYSINLSLDSLALLTPAQKLIAYFGIVALLALLAVLLLILMAAVQKDKKIVKALRPHRIKIGISTSVKILSRVVMFTFAATGAVGIYMLLFIGASWDLILIMPLILLALLGGASCLNVAMALEKKQTQPAAKKMILAGVIGTITWVFYGIVMLLVPIVLLSILTAILIKLA